MSSLCRFKSYRSSLKSSSGFDGPREDETGNFHPAIDGLRFGQRGFVSFRKAADAVVGESQEAGKPGGQVDR
jgi:hypothetical protein